MKAIQISQFGSNDVLKYTELDKPELNSGEVLVKNKAAGVNPIDWKTCSGGGAAHLLASYLLFQVGSLRARLKPLPMMSLNLVSVMKYSV